MPEEQAGSYSQSLQENILSVLAFSDDHSLVLSNIVRPELFESTVYQEIVGRMLSYINQYRRPPKAHLGDLLEDILSQQDDRSQLYANVLQQIKTLSQDINEQYVLDSMDAFVHKQQLTISAVHAVRALKSGDIASAEDAFASALQQKNLAFNPGISFADPTQAFSFRYNHDEEAYLMGIPPLDRYDVGPARKQLWTFMAGAGRGKSWALIHLGKAALVQGLRVVHITLELSEQFTSRRYAQSLFSMTSRPRQGLHLTKLGTNSIGLVDSLQQKVLYRPAFSDMGAWSSLLQRYRQLYNLGLYIKEFPTSALTIKALRAYLSNLESVKGFRPDLIIIDYADLMSKNRDNLRLELQRIYEELRGMAVEENVAIATATQANRQAESVRHLTLEHLAEDYGKAAISDKILAFCQTSEEYILGLARLFVAKCRSDRQNFSVVVSQNYAIGQFCVQSAEFKSADYWSQVDSFMPSNSGTLPRRSQS